MKDPAEMWNLENQALDSLCWKQGQLRPTCCQAVQHHLVKAAAARRECNKPKCRVFSQVRPLIWQNGKGQAEHSLLHYALGLCFFASVFFLQLTAGPGQAGPGQGSDSLSVG